MILAHLSYGDVRKDNVILYRSLWEPENQRSHRFGQNGNTCLLLTPIRVKLKKAGMAVSRIFAEKGRGNFPEPLEKRAVSGKTAEDKRRAAVIS